MGDIMKALYEGSNASGGFTVPTEFSNQLLALMNKVSITMDDLDQRNMISNVQYIPKVTSGSTAYWPAELSANTASNPGFGNITLTAKKVAAITNVSTEILEDNNVDLANSLVTQMGTDVALAVDNEIYNGTGANFSGLRMTGVFTNAVDGSGNINATAAGGTGSTISSGTISLSLISKAVIEVLKDNQAQPDVSYWNARTYGNLLNLTDSTSRPVINVETYGSPSVVRDGRLQNLYGTQVKVSAQVPITVVYGTTAALSACTDAFIGKSKAYGLLGNRRGFSWKTQYQISTDTWDYQTTGRFAFATKYPDAYCLIRAITN
jgi:HK97 family phage major capsid protein